jgi:hypothetical protein
MNRATVLPFAIMLIAGGPMAVTSAALAGPRDELIAKHAAAYGVPENLVRRVIHIESRGNPRVISKGNYGLMQIRLGTARAMGYSGTVEGLLDPDTNMTYAVKYLAGAYRAARCNAERAIAYYQRGYYGRAQTKCSVPQPAVTQVAKAETDALANRGVTEAAPGVLRPRVVRIESITKSNAVPSTPPKVAAFDPVRVVPAQPPEGAVAVAKIDTVPVPLPRVRPAKAPKLAKAEPVEAVAQDTVVAKLEPSLEPALESVPLPPVRPEIAAEPAEPAPQAKRETKPARHARHRHTHRRAKADDTPPIVALFKKLTTPEKSSRRRGARVQTPSPQQTY